VQERVPIAGACVLPIELVQNVFGGEAKRHFVPFATRGVTGTEIKKVVAGHAGGVVASGILCARVAPSGQEMETADEGNVDIGKPGGSETRRVDDLLAIESRCGASGRNSIQEGSASCEAEPVVDLALCG